MTSDETLDDYFKYLWFLKNIDSEQIIDLHEKGFEGTKMPFREIGDRFRLIDSETSSVYIAVNENRDLIDQIKHGVRNRTLFRKLNQFAVNLYPNQISKLMENGSLTQLDDDIYVVENPAAYDNRIGLILEPENNGLYF